MASGGLKQGRFGRAMGGSYFPPMIKFLLASNIGLFLFQLLFGKLMYHGIPLDNYIVYYGYLWPHA
jgi:hypothetical protein